MRDSEALSTEACVLRALKSVTGGTGRESGGLISFSNHGFYFSVSRFFLFLFSDFTRYVPRALTGHRYRSPLTSPLHQSFTKIEQMIEIAHRSQKRAPLTVSFHSTSIVHTT